MQRLRLAAVLWMVVVAGCGRAPTVTDTIIYARGGDSFSLDPIHVDTGESVKVIINLYDTLVTYADDSVELVPALAQSWTTSEDGRTWTFVLREGVTFHDGTACDAKAAKTSLERLIVDDHPLVHSSVVPYRPSYECIESIDAPDARTLVIRLSEPNAAFLANLAMFPASIVSTSAAAEFGADFGQHPVGTGPFRFERWVRDQEIVLAASASHWRGKPKAERLIFVPVKENAVRIEQLKRGEVHIADDLPPAELDHLANQTAIALQETDGLNLAYLAINVERPPLDQRELREAICHAIDKRRLIDLLYGGHARVATNPMPPSILGWNEQTVDRAYDVEQARSLVAAAQAAAGFELPLELDLLVMASARPYMQQPQETAVFIKEQLRAIGIEARIVVSETSQHFQRLSRGEHHLGLAGWSSDNLDPDNFLYQLLDQDNISDQGGSNICRYRNAELHDLLLAAQRELDRDRRAAMYRHAQEIIFHDAPLTPLVHTHVRVAMRSQLKGYTLHPTSLPWMRTAHVDNR